MNDIVAFLDTALAHYLSPLWRALLWGALSGALSMGIYARLVPGEKLAACKSNQKTLRAALLRHEGPFAELRGMIRKDFVLSLTLCAYALPVVFVSALPAVGLLFGLMPLLEAAPYPSFGPAWTASFEFWYIFAAFLSSLILKFLFRIE